MTQEQSMNNNDNMNDLIATFKEGVNIKDRKYRLTTYKQCFVGKQAVDFLVSSGIASTRQDAIMLGNSIMPGVFEHVTRDHEFCDDDFYYRFLDANERGGTQENASTGKKYGWTDFLAPTSFGKEQNTALQPEFPGIDLEAVAPNDVHVASQVWPLDKYNAELLNNVHPAKWVDPNSTVYDLVVIGGGTAGLITAAGSAGVGAKVALIEAHLLGGDCLNVGCVPSKTIIHAANLAHTVQNDKKLAEAGISVGNVSIDFAKVMERVRKIRSQISHHDSAERYSKELGVEVFIGHGKFTSENTVTVNGKTLSFKRAAICTGGYPTLIPLPGLQELYEKATSKTSDSNSYTKPIVVTNETIFNMTHAPERLVVVGAGVIGLEMAQALQRLGVQVTVLGRSGKILNKEDEDLADIVKAQMVEDGVDFKLSVQEYQKIELTGKAQADNGYPEMKVTVLEKGADAPTELLCDAFLVAAGRRPNVSGMDLELAKVEYDTKTGLKVDDFLRTTNPRVYGVGDVCSQYKFTHAADFMARAVIRNALFFGKEKMSKLLIPYATFTSPEIASVGLYEQDLKAKGIAYKIIEKHFKDNDRAIADDETTGLVRFRVDAKSDKILGASIVGAGAGNLISEVTLAMQSDTGLGKLAAVIHPYPTTGEAIRQSGDLYNKARLTNTVKQLLRGIVKLQR